MPKVVKPQTQKEKIKISDSERRERTEERKAILRHDVPSLSCVIGVDEAGLGALFGCFLTAACILPESVVLPELNDSKELSPVSRDKLFEKIIQNPDIVYHYHITEREEIDRVGIYQANHNAMVLCVDEVIAKSLTKFKQEKHIVLIDGNKVPKHLKACPAEAIVKGDAKCQSISAASILCKVVRDRIMMSLHETYPSYEIASHKGYGTQVHRDAIMKFGPCIEHRKTYNPVKTMLADGKCDASIWDKPVRSQ